MIRTAHLPPWGISTENVKSLFFAVPVVFVWVASVFWFGIEDQGVREKAAPVAAEKTDQAPANTGQHAPLIAKYAHDQEDRDREKPQQESPAPADGAGRPSL